MGTATVGVRWKPRGKVALSSGEEKQGQGGGGKERDGGLRWASEGWVGPRSERGRNRSGREPADPGHPSCHLRTQSDFLTWVTLPPRGVSITATGIKITLEDFSCGPVYRNPPSNAGDVGSIPARGAKIPQTSG